MKKFGHRRIGKDGKLVVELLHRRLTAGALLCGLGFGLGGWPHGMAQSVVPQPGETLIKVERAEAFSSAAPDLVAESQRGAVVLISKAHRRQLGFPDHKGQPYRQFQLYQWQLPLDQHLRVHRLPSDFDRDLHTIGFSRHQSTGLYVTTRMAPISRSNPTGEGMIDLPQLATPKSPKSALGKQLEQVANFNRSWSAFHPALHPSGELLVFAANRTIEGNRRMDPDGTGKVDLYFTCKFGNYWSTPMQFDSLINSPEDELFPSFSASGELYFASNRVAGCGFDIYKAAVDFRAIFDAAHRPWWGVAERLPAPINTPFDEVALVWTYDTTGHDPKGYFSRRIPGSGTDFDVWSFQLAGANCHGEIVTAADASPISGATVVIVDDHGDSTITSTDTLGRFRLFLKFGRQFRLTATAPRHLPSSQWVVSTQDLPQNVDMMEAIVIPLEKVDVPQKTFVGTVKTYGGRSLLHDTEIAFYSEMPDFELPPFWTQDEHFSFQMDQEMEFYLDVTYAMLGSTTANTWHYLPRLHDGEDTVAIDLRVHDSTFVIQRITVVVRGGEGVPKMVYGFVGQREGPRAPARELATDVMFDDAFVRMAVPTQPMPRGTLVMQAAGAMPSILPWDPQAIPDTVWMTASRLRFDEPIIILHQFNEGQPDFKLSGTNLETIALFLKGDSVPQVCIQSYTDCRGSDAYNLRLSRMRAAEVKRYIVDHTRADFSTRITADGYGKAVQSKPCIDCTEKDHQDNRRTEIYLTHGTCPVHAAPVVIVR